MAARKRSASAAHWRASWKGDLTFGLVRFAVEAINAHSQSGSDVHFHQLHASCHSRIEYQKVCPIHGEVAQDEIVLGHEVGRGKYVEVEPDELDALRTQRERALVIEEFVPAAELDDLYLDGRHYYLVPAKAVDQEPYQLLRRALAEDGWLGVGQVVLSGKEQLVLLRPRGNILLMEMLNYAAELRDPRRLGVGKADEVSTRPLRLARDLIRSMSAKSFDIAKYEDHYRDRVKELIAAKRKGKTLELPDQQEEAPVINLLEALEKSLASHRPTRRKEAPRAKRRGKPRVPARA